MDWQERMNAAIDYLESHLDGSVEWQFAAAEANCSTFHFLRMFEVVTGVPAGEYVRRRRLSKAALAIASGETRVIDLALDAGYESPDAFTRAFKREFGVTPSEARGPGVRLRTWPKLEFSIVLKGDVPMNYRIEQHEEIRMTGLPFRSTTTDGSNQKEIPKFWDRINSDGTMDAFCKAMPKDSKLGIMGVCVDDYNEATGEFTYLAAIESPANRSTLPEECIEVKAKAGTWAIFESRGALPQAIHEVWRRIMSEWFPGSGYEHRSAPEIEVYPEGDISSADYYCEVWIPVQKSKAK